MDAFEHLVSEILWSKGYWVRTSFKVELSKEEKRAIGRHSSPRWELDVVAYSGRLNVIQVVECKSYLDSPGVVFSAFEGKNAKQASRYKLFNEPELRKVVFDRLVQQLVECGACPPTPSVRLALACGRIKTDRDRHALRAHFSVQDWDLWDESWLRSELRLMAGRGYENEVSAVVAKLLLRGQTDISRAPDSGKTEPHLFSPSDYPNPLKSTLVSPTAPLGAEATQRMQLTVG
ncbi:MAG: hypothetical protein WDN45_07645 [Caulobacteraceae bacterium]